MTVTLDQFALAALNAIGKDVSTNNVKSLVIWECSENDSNNNASKADWNPFDTTQHEPGATNFNDAGVKNYPDILTGLNAFKATIENGLYASILKCLTENAIPAETCSAITNSAWGSKPTSTLQLMILDNWDAYSKLLVGGSDSDQVDSQNNPIKVVQKAVTVNETPSEKVETDKDATSDEIEAAKDAAASETNIENATESKDATARKTAASYLRTHAQELTDLANDIEEGK